MSNNFTKNYQDGQALTESQLDTAFQTVKPSLDNLALSTTGSTSGTVLQSNGNNVTPSWVTFNEVVTDNSVSAATANKIVEAVTGSAAAAAVINAQVRPTGTSVTLNGVAISNTNFGQDIDTANLTSAFTSLACTVTTSGRPVFVGLVGTGTNITSGNYSYIRIKIKTGSSGQNSTLGWFIFKRDSTTLSVNTLGASTLNTEFDDGDGVYIPPSSMWYIDTPGSGTYTYTLNGAASSNDVVEVENVKLVAYEL